MPDKAWKKRERDVANYFNGMRTPLSGGNGKITRADVIHDNLFIDYYINTAAGPDPTYSQKIYEYRLSISDKYE